MGSKDIARALTIFGLRRQINRCGVELVLLDSLDASGGGCGQVARDRARQQVTERLESYREALRIKLGETT